MRRLHDIHSALERAVFLANYNTPRQRLLRLVATTLITARHSLRGLLYVWPLTLLLFLNLPGAGHWLRAGLGLLAVAAWFRYIYGSVRDDYARFVAGRLLEPVGLRRLF
ncbi:MAG: hypothetical protein ABR553_07510 [Gammaproteobacteria bacterium]